MSSRCIDPLSTAVSSSLVKVGTGVAGGVASGVTVGSGRGVAVTVGVAEAVAGAVAAAGAQSESVLNASCTSSGDISSNGNASAASIRPANVR